MTVFLSPLRGFRFILRFFPGAHAPGYASVAPPELAGTSACLVVRPSRPHFVEDFSGRAGGTPAPQRPLRVFRLLPSPGHPLELWNNARPGFTVPSEPRSDERYLAWGVSPYALT